MRQATAVLLTLLTSGLMGGLIAASANAEEPPRLDQGYVADYSGVLDAEEEARLEARLGELASSNGLPELYVVLVPDFEDPSNALRWADETAELNTLAPDQYLLAIATDGRSLAISAEYGGGDVAAGPLSESRVLEIEDALGADYLSAGDWAGGIAYVADEFTKVPTPWWVWALGVVGFALLVFLVARLVIFLRQRAALAADLRTLEGQTKRAARLLVRSDEAVRTSEQELGYVTAEFGEETTAEFAVVLTSCRTRLQEAFELLEKLQDSEKDSLQETRTWTNRIITLCGEVDADLEGRKREISSLRALADSAADTLARLRAARADADALPQQASERIVALAAVFPPADLIAVSDNAGEIRQRLSAADAQLAALQKAVETRKPKAITLAVHETERLLAEARELRTAIEAQAEALAARSTAPVEDATTILEQAAAAVRAAESSVQARPGQIGAFPLARLHSAQRQLALARQAVDTAEGERLAGFALATAEQVQSLIGAPQASERGRYLRPAPEAGITAVMYDSPADKRPLPRRTWVEEEEPSRGPKALLGAFGGGFVGLFGSLGVADGEPAVVLSCIIAGAVLGALSGAFGGSGGGSSSGWGGSSRSSSGRSSWSSSSRSSSSRSSSSSSSRSSGRSGGRHF